MGPAGMSWQAQEVRPEQLMSCSLGACSQGAFSMTLRLELSTFTVAYLDAPSICHPLVGNIQEPGIHDLIQRCLSLSHPSASTYPRNQNMKEGQNPSSLWSDSLGWNMMEQDGWGGDQGKAPRDHSISGDHWAGRGSGSHPSQGRTCPILCSVPSEG